MKANKAAEGSK